MIRGHNPKSHMILCSSILCFHVTNMARHICNLMKLMDTELNSVDVYDKEPPPTKLCNSLIMWLYTVLDK